MRFVLCILFAAMLSAPALAEKEGTAISLSSAQAAAAKGDQKAALALATMPNQAGCMNGCSSRGHSKSDCTYACRPGLCHPDAETPYCVSK
jgi:hypothetical protein